MMELVAQGKIKKKILPGSEPPNISKSVVNLQSLQQTGCRLDKYGRDYVNDGLNEYDEKSQENNKVIYLLFNTAKNVPCALT